MTWFMNDVFSFDKGGDFMHKPDRNKDAKYRTVDQMMSYTNLCRGTIVKLATEARAYIHIGRAVRIDAAKFFDYVEKEYME